MKKAKKLSHGVSEKVLKTGHSKTKIANFQEQQFVSQKEMQKTAFTDKPKKK